MLHSWGTWATMNKKVRSKQNFVLCPLTNGFGILWGKEGEVHVYHKTLSFLSSAVFHTHSFSGCRLCLQHFCSSVLAPLLATELLCPTVTRSHAVSHMSCVAQFSVPPGGNGSWCCSVSDRVWSLAEHPGLLLCVAAQLFPWPGEDLAATLTGHFYALPKVGTKKPNTEAVFLQQFFSLLVLFIPRSFGFFPHCSSWYCLLLLWEPLCVLSRARITAGFSVTYCPPHCVWQMDKAGRQKLWILKVVVHIVPASFPSASQHAGWCRIYKASSQWRLLSQYFQNVIQPFTLTFVLVFLFFWLARFETCKASFPLVFPHQSDLLQCKSTDD